MRHMHKPHTKNRKGRFSNKLRATWFSVKPSTCARSHGIMGDRSFSSLRRGSFLLGSRYAMANMAGGSTAENKPQQPTRLSFPGDASLSSNAHIIGVILDNHRSFNHTSNQTQSCRFLLQIRRIWTFLSTEASQVLLQSFVISRLGQLNSLPPRLPPACQQTLVIDSISPTSPHSYAPPHQI